MKPSTHLSRVLPAVVAAMSFLACAEPDLPPEEAERSSGIVLSPYGTVKWFFAAGRTGPGTPDYHSFQTYYHFLNQTTGWVQVAMHVGGATGPDSTFWLPPSSRTSHAFNQPGSPLVGPVGPHAVEFYSATPGAEIQVSSTTFNNAWTGVTWDSSKAVNGATEARTVWWFGEGGAFGVYPPIGRPVFDHYYAVYNPGGTPLTVKTTFLPDQHDNGGVGEVADLDRAVPARSGIQFEPYNPAWGPLHSRAARVECTQPCVVEMVMYQRNGVPGRRPNTQSALGAESKEACNPAGFRYYVVGIPTLPNWQERIYFVNTSNQHNRLFLTFRNAAGATVATTDTTVLPRNRISYDLSGIYPGSANLALPPQGYSGGNLSLEVYSVCPFALTKIGYWGAGFDWNEGASTTGHREGGRKVVFPGGNIGGGFKNLTQIMNVGGAATNVRVTYYHNTHGKLPTLSMGILPARGVMQIDAASNGVPEGDFATVIESDGPPLVAESSNLFNFDTPSPHLLWRAGDSVEGIVYSGGSPVQP